MQRRPRKTTLKIAQLPQFSRVAYLRAKVLDTLSTNCHEQSLLFSALAQEEALAMPMKDGTRVLGTDADGCVMFEANGVVNHTCESPAEFVEWYGLEDMDEVERRSIGIAVH